MFLIGTLSLYFGILLHEEIGALCLSIVRGNHSVTNSSFMSKDLVIIATNKGLVAKKVYRKETKIRYFSRVPSQLSST